MTKTLLSYFHAAPEAESVVEPSKPPKTMFPQNQGCWRERIIVVDGKTQSLSVTLTIKLSDDFFTEIAWGKITGKVPFADVTVAFAGLPEDVIILTVCVDPVTIVAHPDNSIIPAKDKIILFMI